MINKFITLTILTILSLSATSSLAQPDPYNGYAVRHFTDENGLPQNSINDLLFDDNGFLWLASQVGLIRFNGNSFKLFYPENKRGMESNVWRLGKDNERNICFKTLEGKLYRVNSPALNTPCLLNGTKQLFNFTRFLNDSTPGTSREQKQIIFKDLLRHNENFYPVDTAQLYLLYNDTLYYYDSREMVVLASRAGKASQYLTLDGRFYMLKRDSVVDIYEHGRAFHGAGIIRGDLHIPPALSHQPPALRFFAGQTIHLLVNDKLYRITTDNDGMLKAEFLLDLDFSSHITAIAYNTALDLLLIATLTEGFYSLHKNRFLQPGRTAFQKQLSSQYIDGPLVLHDSTDIITTKFIFNDLGKFTFTKDSLPTRQKCLFIDKHDQVWGAIFNLPRKMTAALETVQVYPALDAQIVDFMDDPGNNLYCLTQKSLYRLRSDTFQLLFNNRQVSQNGSNNESFCMISPYRFWIANTNGLIDFDVTKHEAHLIPALSGAHVRSIHKCRDGSVLIGTYGQGYYYYHNNRFFKMPLDKNGFLITAHCFLEDGHGMIWIPCNKGLFKVPKADMDCWCDSSGTQLYYYHYGMQDGLRTNEFNGGHNAPGLITNDGYAALLSMKGIVSFHTDSLPASFPNGRIDITNVEIDGQFGMHGDKIELPPGYNNLLLEISCPFLGDRNNLYLEYSLKGLSDQWKEVPDDGSINLSRLGPGNYTLSVRKVNGFGRNNYQYREWNIIVAPHFYQTTWFMLLAILTLLLLLILLVQLWLKLVEKRQEVRIKAEKLKGTVVALEETIEKLQESQKALLQNSKLKEKLISLVIHDLRSPLRFLTMLATDLHDNQANFSAEEIRERSYWIKKGTHDVYNFSEDFLLWVTSQKNNFSITKHIFPLRPLLQEIYDFFREQVRQKGNNIYCEAAEDLNIYSDPHILITIIRNLVDNANKYTDRGSIMISASEDDSCIIIAVYDTGRGMTVKQIEAFTRNDSLDDVKSGSQLGHKFIFDLTKRIDGTVSVESREGEGTTVSLRLPKV